MCLCFYWQMLRREVNLLLQRGCHIWFYHTALKFSSIIVPRASFPQLGIDATVDSSCGPAPAVVFYDDCMLRQERAPEGQLLLRQEQRCTTTVDSSWETGGRGGAPPWTAPNSCRLKVLRCLHLTETAISTAPVGLLTAAVGWPGMERRSQPLIWLPLRCTVQGLQRWQILEFPVWA